MLNLDAYYFPFHFYSVERSNKNLSMLYEKLDKDEAWVTPQSTPFLNDRSESLDIPSAMDRGTGNQIYTNI